MRDKRERVTFDPNTPVKITFAYDGGKEFQSQFDGRIQTMYTLQDDRVLFASEDLAVKINYCEPKAGDTLWVTHKSALLPGRGPMGKRRRLTSWEVSASEPGVIQRPAYDSRAAVEATGVEESPLERELRESSELRKRAVTRSQARENVARMPEPEPPAWVDAAPHSADALQPARKPPATETAAMPAPAPKIVQTAPQAQARPGWYASLVEQTSHLIDALAEVRAHAERHGQRISSEDCEKLLVTTLIGKQRQRA